MPERLETAGAAAVRLIGADEPPPCEVANPDGSAPVLFICDHASRAIPESMDGLGLDDSVLYQHVAWDIGAADAARHLSARFDAPLVLAGYSRLVIDCNRARDDPTSIAEASEGTAIPGNRAVGEDEAAARAAALFTPYHETIAGTIARMRGRGAAPVLVSVHSFTPIYEGVERPWDVGILWNRDGRLAEPLIARLALDPEVAVGDNQPYSARDGYGYSMERHAEPAGIPHVLVEFRQDLVDTHHGAEAWAERLGRALDAVLRAEPGLGRTGGA